MPQAAKTYSIKGEAGIVGGETDTENNTKGIVVGVASALTSTPTPGASSAEAEVIVIDTEKGVPGFWTEPARDLPGNWQYIQDHPDSSADGWFVTYASLS